MTIRAVGAGWPRPGVVRLHLSVEDTGIGIAEGDLERVFGAFEQAESGHDRGHDGAGLGLAVTHRLVELMGGEVWADSAPGTGSCFGFRIDLPAASDGAGEGRGASRPGPAGRPAREGASLAEADGPGLAETPARGAGEGRPPPPLPGSGEAEASAEPPPPLFRRRGTEPAATGGRSDEPLGTPPEHGSSGAAPEAGQTARRSGLGPRADGPDREPSEAGFGAGTARRMRVMAAEDNQANRLILERMLGGLDVELVFATDGAEAVAAFEREPFDLVLMDVSMPRMDGREATRRIRAAEADGPRVPIVAVTAHAMPGDEPALREAGFDGLVPKPLRKAAIREVVVRNAPPGVRPPDPKPPG